MVKDFSKKQVLRSASGMLVLSDGTGTHLTSADSFWCFSGTVLFDPLDPFGARGTCGAFCKTLDPGLFEPVRMQFFLPETEHSK